MDDPAAIAAKDTRVGPDDDLRALSDAAVLQLVDELRRRRPGAAVASSGVRPRRRPWTYRDIWRLEALLTEATRRGLI